MPSASESPVPPPNVLDLSDGIAGAYACRLLAYAGADVLRGEEPGGDPDRHTALWRFLRHGIGSVQLDAADELAGRVRAADIVIHSGGSRAQSVLNGPLRPSAIVTAITPYGLDGPYRDVPASVFTLEAESGSLATRGLPGDDPFMAGGRTWEWISGAYAAAATLSAWRRRLQTGHGESVDVSMFEVTHVAGTSYSPLTYRLGGSPEITAPARVVESVEIHPASDGWVGFTTNSAQQFQDFLVLIERADLLADEELALASTRWARYDEWTSIVNEWTSRHATDEIVERASALRIPVAPVLNASTVGEFPHFVERGVFVSHGDGDFVMPRRPWRVDDEDPPSPGATPTVGMHQEWSEATDETPAPAPPGLPLEGVRVLDLTAWWAGPTGSHLLASLGADVIHVESPRRLDGMRMTGGMFRDQGDWWERSSFFLSVNSNKRGLTLDLEQPAGREAIDRLIQQTDVIVENFTPRVLDNLGIGWERIHELNPSAILVRMPAFGLEGPWRDNPGFAQTMEQLSGLAWLTGEADGQPHNQRGPCDPNGGVHAAFTAIAALIDRDHDGRGRHVEVPFIEVALNAAAEQIVDYSATGNLQQRDGNRSPDAAPQGIYRCRGDEQWIALSVESDEQWPGLATAIGRPELATDDALSDLRGRRAQHDGLDKIITAWTEGRDVDEVVQVLRSHRVPAAPVVDPRRSDQHAQMSHRGLYETLDHPVVGRQPFVTQPFRLASVDRWLWRAAPTVGQDNTGLLGELGYSSDEISALRDAGIIAEHPIGM